MKIYFQKHNLNNYQIYPEPQDKANWIAQDINESELESHVLVEFNGNYQWVEKSADPLARWNGNGWTVDEEKATALLQHEREQICEKINQYRDDRTAGGVYIKPLNKWLDSDTESKTKILGVKMAMDANPKLKINWTCADNSEIELDRNGLMAVIQGILETENANHHTARQHKQAVMQSPTPANYNYRTGWAENYNDIKEKT
ncbi:DUF4376 domain-containing protein, partial [Seminibacterium arietis]